MDKNFKNRVQSGARLKELCGQYLAGNKSVQEELAAECIKYGMPVIRSFSANGTNTDDFESAIHEAFMHTLHSPTLRSAEEFPGYFTRAVQNKCRDIVRKRTIELRHRRNGSNNPGVSTIDLHDLPDSLAPAVNNPPCESPLPEEVLQEFKQHCRAALCSVPKDSVRMWIAHRNAQLSYKEISDSFSIPMGTVNASLHNVNEALRRLRDDLPVMPDASPMHLKQLYNVIMETADELLNEKNESPDSNHVNRLTHPPHRTLRPGEPVLR